MSVSIWFDGGCKPHSPGGHGIYGYVIKQDGDVLVEESGYIDRNPDMTNNVAEYTALIEAISTLLELDSTAEHVHIHGDSELIINQLKGDYNIYSPRLRPLYVTANTLLDKLDAPVQFQWVPRDQNERADELAEQAYRDHTYKHQEQTARDTTATIVAIGEHRYTIDGETVDLVNGSCTCSAYQEHGAKCMHLFKADLLESGEF